MDKVLFIMRYPLDEKHHLQNKFNGEMQAMINLGYEVHHLGYCAEGIYLVNFNTKERKKLCNTLCRKYRKYRNTFGFLDLYRGLTVLARTECYKYMYMRFKVIDALGLRAINRIKENGAKLIVEIPSYQSIEKELSISRSIIRAFLSRWTQKLNTMVDLYTIIGPDSGGSFHGRPAINIMNGVDLDQLPLRNYNPTNSIHFLALASMRIWHAFDRLIIGLADYKGDIPIIIDMVGGDNDGSLAAWKALAKEKGVDHKIVFHGPMYGDDLSKMFDIADIGVATLGLHRNKMSSGSVLKLGEYCARGLPFIYGYNDRTFTGKEEFALKVSEDEKPIDFDVVMQWVAAMRRNPNMGKKMRSFAKEKMTWEISMRKVICFFEGARNE